MDPQNNNTSEQSSNNHPDHQSNESSTEASTYDTSSTDPFLLSRQSEDSDYYRNFLEQLLDLVCSENQEIVTQLVSIIRSGASQNEILAAISGLQNEDNPTTEENGTMAPDDQGKHSES
ncbi:hypothetical protein BDV28DRAFT_152216 [Aspergillus coremiiformis]|uniref:Uncharacterized protein n=1 Tax=Aspergillus coremiiformis TaxID=138285 RepID=A0A5N6YZF0_9EURO|nr:hypothetical protein BDV28DRAFT_152216 [Aspergillus coremiiformis]